MVLKQLLDFNLFQPAHQKNEDEYQRQSGRIATRIYLVAFVFVLIGTSIGLWLTQEARGITISNPTKEQFQTMPVDAQCPCSQLSFPYGTFLTVQHNFHQVCTSDFVSERWIRVLFSGTAAGSFYPSDIRSAGSAQFQVLASFCRLARKRLEGGLDSLYATPFISTNVLHNDLFRFTVDAAILNFKFALPFLLQSEMDLINKITFGNQLTPALDGTFDLYYFDQLVSGDIILYTMVRTFVPINQSYCYCINDYNCIEQSGIYSVSMSNDSDPIFYAELLMNITGLVAGCTPVNSILQSTLECFYNQICVNSILSHISDGENFTAMVAFENSHFPSNATVQALIDQIMLEELTYNASYETYFAQCNPRMCSYTKMKRRDSLYVLVHIIGLLGGLTITLGFIIPSTVRFIRNRRLQRNEQKPAVSMRLRLVRWKSRAKQAATELNMFNNSVNGDDYTLFERRITRLFIVLLTASFLTITIYLLSTETVYRETIMNPTESTYDELKQKYRNNLVCPCRNLSTTYGSFLSITPIYHEICSSDFISSEWMNFLTPFTAYTDIAGYQYQINFVAQFNILATFCSSAAQTIEGARRDFLRNQYVTSEVTDRMKFQSQISSLIEQWKSNTQHQYARLLQLIRETNQGNKLVNYLANVNFRFDRPSKEMYYVPLNYSNCSCDLFGSCTVPISYAPPANVLINVEKRLVITNLSMGCYPVEALRQSTLECLANQTCLDQVIASALEILFNYNVPMNFTILNITDEQAQETIGSIVDRLMVDDWILNISFTSYYLSCAPVCTYEYKSKHRALIVFSATIGVFGGLTRALKILTSITVIFVEHLLKIHSFSSVMQFIKSMFNITNEQKRTNQLHILLLLTILTTLYLSSFLPLQVKTVAIDRPSLPAYKKSIMQFPETLECACSRISIDYGAYATVEARFHQICSSDFVTNDWIMHIYEENNRSRSKDDRQTTLGQYQLLISFCQLAEITVNHALSQLRTSNQVRTSLLSFDSLQQTTREMVDEFASRTARSFINTLDLVRETTAGNMLMNLYSTNWQYRPVKLRPRYWDYRTVPMSYQQCNCGISSNCSQVLGNDTIGCYPLETVLQSTLACFYDQQCIDPSGLFKALNLSSNASQFPIDATVQSLLTKLLVEEYRINTSYERYFNQCAVSACSYSFLGNANPIDTAVTLIELFGGLAIISHWITLAIVKLCQYRRRLPPSNTS